MTSNETYMKTNKATAVMKYFYADTSQNDGYYAERRCFA